MNRRQLLARTLQCVGLGAIASLIMPTDYCEACAEMEATQPDVIKSCTFDRTVDYPPFSIESVKWTRFEFLGDGRFGLVHFEANGVRRLGLVEVASWMIIAEAI